MSLNYLRLRNSNLSSFNAITINYSTLAGSTITGSTIASISTISVSTIFNSTINASLVNYSTLVGSTISTVTFRASTIGIGTAPTASPMTVFNGGPAPYTSAPTMTISDGAPITTGTYGMVHLTRPSGVLDYKGYLTFIRNGSTNVHMMGYLQNSDTFGWIVTNATSNPMNTLKGIFMDSNGNVGIGVTNPTYKLHVVGSIYADNLNMSYFNAIGGQKAGGIFFTGDIPAAQWQIAIIGDYKLGFNINNTGTDGYSPSYTPVITFGNTGSITCSGLNSTGPISFYGNALVPIGCIMLFYNSNIPAGWALCNGQQVSRTDGGGLITTPDLVSRFVYGGSGADWTGRGSTTKTLAVGNLPAHNHGVTDGQHNHGITDNGHRHQQMWTNPGGGYNWINNAGQTALDNFTMGIYTGWSTTGISINNANSNISIQNTGSNQAFDIMPPYIILCYIMKH